MSEAERALEAPEPAFMLVSRPGWIAETAFAHGSHLIGSLPKDFVFHPQRMELGDRPGKVSVRGSLREWKKFARRVAKDQPLVTFLLCVAFASMILHLLKVQPFVVLLYSDSSVGKSYRGEVRGLGSGGRSVEPGNRVRRIVEGDRCGAGEGSSSRITIWCTVLNEFSRVQGSPEKRVEILEAMVSDLCAGIPKTRGTDRKGALRYSTCGIITSNKSYPELLAKAHGEPGEAMRPRLFELCADLGSGFGVFSKVPPCFKSSSEAIKAMRDAADAELWLARPDLCRTSSANTRPKAPPWSPTSSPNGRSSFQKRLGPDLTGVEGQIRDKLAAVGVAGMLAKRLGVMPKDD